jgi:FlaA1/EpsC-like NDP-sugar epimerase
MFEKYPIISEKIRNKILPFIRKNSVPRWMVFLHDSIAVFFTFWMAYLLRYNFVSNDFHTHLALQQAIITTGMYMVFSMVFRSYSGMIRHTTIIDIFYVFMATTLSFISLTMLALTSRLAGWSSYLNLPITFLVSGLLSKQCII